MKCQRFGSDQVASRRSGIAMPSLSVAEAIRARADTILVMNSYIGLFEWLIFAAISAIRVQFIFGSNIICLERWLAPKLLSVCVDPPAPETYVCACWLHDGKLHNTGKCPFRHSPHTTHVARCTPHTTHCAPHAAHHSPLVHHYRLRGPSFSPSDRTLRARFALHQKGTMALSSDTEVWHARPATVALPRANTLHVPIALTLQPPHRPRAVLCSPRCAATSRSSASGLPTARGG